jgi:hypothetical protein
MQEQTKQQLLTIDEKNDFVFRTLFDRKNWTEDVVAGLMSRAHVAPPAIETKCRKMAIKFLWLLNHSVKKNPEGKNWIPTHSCVDLTTTGASLTREEEAMSLEEVRESWAVEKASAKRTRRVRRHFKNCLQCGKRFLPKRRDAEFHNEKCQQRYRRVNPIPVPAPLTAIIAQATPQPA